MPWRGHLGSTVKFSLGKAEGGNGLGGRVSAGSGLEPRLTRSEGPRAPEGENDDSLANRSSPFGDASTCSLTSPKWQVRCHPIFQVKLLRLTGGRQLLVVTQSVSSSARSSAEVFLTPVVPSIQS